VNNNLKSSLLLQELRGWRREN